MLRLANPYYLLLFLPWAFAVWQAFRRRRRAAMLFAATARLPARVRSWRGRLRMAWPALFLAGAALAIVALARPQTVLSKTTQHADAIAIEMVVDCSGSMEALDFSSGSKYVSRLDVVKETFGRFVQKRTGDLIGLVTFGGFASTRAPLTLDHQALLHVLGGVEVPRTVVDKEGRVLNQEEMLTAIGDGLATACARLDTSELKSRIAVLLSDGESNTGVVKPEEAADAAKRLGIRVYTIGVGTTGIAPAWMTDPFGNRRIGQMHVRLDEEMLTKIAAATGGKYFNVRNPRALDEAMADIDRLEKTRIEKQVYQHYRELFPWFLLPGFLCVALGSCLGIAAGRTVV